MLFNNYVYSVGGVIVSDNEYLPYFVKMDYPVSDTVYTRIYTDLFENLQVYFTHVLQEENSLYTIGSTSDDNYHVDLSFHKLDTLGIIQFNRNYGPTSSHPDADVGNPLQIVPASDGGFAITFEERFSGGYMTNQDAYCLKVDSLGNEQWRCAIGHHDTVNYRPFVFPQENGNFYFTYSDPQVKNTTNPVLSPHLNDSSTIWFGEISAEGDVLWKRNLNRDINLQGHFYVNDVYEDEQGYIYLSGEMEYVDIMGFLLKINPSHEAEWMQQYLCFPDNTDAGGTYTKLYGLTPTSDGGFAMAGEYFSSDSEMFPGGTQSSLVIKVDECGCLEAGCNPDCYTSTPQVQYIRMFPLEVYPNPAGRQISISGSEAGGQLRVYNQQGQVCLETEYRAGNTLDVSVLSSGVYTIRLNAGGKFHRGQFVKE